MDEAIHRLQQAPAPDQAQRLAQRQAQAVATLVRRAAVKHKLRGLGLKPQHYSPAQIGVMAKARLLADTQHRAELIAAARKVVDKWTEEGWFKPRRAARRVQHLQDLHSQRSAEPQALPLCEYRDRNGEGK
jgi:hypothetical protein